ncbi:hypothetical protein ALC56_07322 [Trachymyrmex septentrionalis]|uniref:Uncharacterized protein n=1 Tax=Trachymyrmex septentrionalis TaxID=34720 RepID=A0A195FDK2_9HYME|nr:hypothetical protein ALC56_07322 [Trachymyrmex septentrionalis]
MRGYLQTLQRYRTYAYATEGSAQDWIRRIDNKQSRLRRQRGVRQKRGKKKKTDAQGLQRTAVERRGRTKAPSSARIFYYALNYSVKLARSHNHEAGAAITLVESRKRGGWRMVRGEISPITHYTAYGGARRTHRNTNTNLIRRWDGTPLDVYMRDMAQGDTCSITRLDAGRDGRMRCVRWIVRNILRQAMPNIMPATSTDAGRPVLAAL